MTDGAKVLRNIIQGRGVTYRAAAEQIGCSPGNLHQWAHGVSKPGIFPALAVARWTDGRVTVPSWLTAKQRNALDKVVAP